MHLLSVEHITKSYGEKMLFEDVTFGVEEGEKIGIIGVNGTGKSTFLKVIAGIEPADSGNISIGNRVTVRMLAQDPVFEQGETALEHVLGGQSPQLRAVRDYASALAAIELNPNDEALQQQLISANQRMDEWDAWTLESDAKVALAKLGILNFDDKVDTMSGGQRKRVAMAAALLQPSDILILDEPTNHIDNDSVAWLESMLQKRKGALLMITHDRYFLDRVSNRVIELDKGRAHFYEANYSRFLELKLEREEREAASEDKRQNLLRNELAWIRRGAKARTTKQKARIDRFEALKAQAPKQSGGKMDVSVASSRLGKKIIEIESVSKRFGERTLIRDFSYIAVPEDRVGIVGRNGSGKSTLLKLIEGRLQPDAGSVVLGPTVKLGWFSQEHEEMDESLRVIEYIREGAEQVKTADGLMISAGQMLERFLFAPAMQWSLIAKLSGGEKRRLQLLRVLMNAPNVLLLDEPTNDLDIATLSVLEDYLDDFPGVVFVVSHDRYFLDRTVDKILAFEGEGTITQHTGNYSEYQEFVAKHGSESAATGSGKAAAAAGKPNASAGAEKTEAAPRSSEKALRMSYKEQKDYEQIDGWIAETEEALNAIAGRMDASGSDSVLLQQLIEEQQQLEAKLDQLLERWTELNELAERIAEQKKN
ncbi:ABC-F family ATP-binding cassette domain-containing protein [Paenibacillus radicis (ex Gao et al. 2016)]|uniref:Multidrug ABC transporter ATP-binding protein n=1 Tax=Paenibacillus radicis (ex Gao et al. 2016) TaxID=1737354 RepID=A0A917HFS6_9BACL|nr:ABC-F family ATP-binding cassette domain-containing protein [Paenibacillus radicis (ex Gao et al. 2016)]GGG77945.1 multidrug ABC transporter ATP-binding protein [Paenibacillus radicis (ex Gao et al. 2016)]